MSNIIKLSDIEMIDDKLLVSNIKNRVFKNMSSGVKGTRIKLTNLATGEVKELHNKVVVSGSIAAGTLLFDIPMLSIPTYNSELELENSEEPGTTPINTPKICLFGVGDDGCGTIDSDVYTPGYVDRIPPDKLFPFRYIENGDEDLDDPERRIYFGRKVDDSNNIYYYFKAFNNDPQIYLRYTDGTEINPATMYDVITTQEAECFVQLDINVSRFDFRDYFDKVIGWDKARISSLSLIYAWYTEDGGYKYYQDCIPFTKLNFSFEKLVDNTKALAFEYSLFF